jgi:hypothetical protein
MKNLLIMIAIGSGVISTSTLAYDTSAKWNWFANSYWYVPTKNLTAYEYTPALIQFQKLMIKQFFKLPIMLMGIFGVTLLVN